MGLLKRAVSGEVGSRAGAPLRGVFLAATAVTVLTAGHRPGVPWWSIATLAAAAAAPGVLGWSARVRARVTWSVPLADAVIAALVLVAAAPLDPVLLGSYFLAVVIAVLTAGSAGAPVATLAAPGLLLALRASEGPGLAGADAAHALFLAAASAYFLAAVRGLQAHADQLADARRESRELRTLLEITDAITGTLDARRVMSLIVQRVGEVVGAESCSILVADHPARHCFVVASNDRPEVDMLEIQLDNYPELRQAIETREPVVIDDVQRDPLLRPVRDVLLEKGYRSMVVLPLLFGREVLGTLFLRASRERAFSAQELRFCRVAAGASANALKNALLFEQVKGEAERHRETGEKLRRVLDCSPDLVLATDEAGRITEINAAGERLLGVSADAVRGRTVQEMLGEVRVERTAGEVAAAPVDARLTVSDGTERELSLVSAPLVAADGRPAGDVWLGRDLTHVRRVERSLAQAERLSTLGEIVAGVAHELNNPMSAVLGYAELVRKNVESEDHVRDLERIVHAARRCKRIVENLLGFARRHRPEKKPENVNECVRRVVDLRAYTIRSEGIEVRLELDPEIPAAEFDAFQIEQVLLNLVTNAEHAVRANAGARTITVRTAHGEHDIAVEVEDDGPGVPPELHGRVFDPFFTTKGVGHGTGLGLSVSYGIVREHGGTLDLAPYACGRGARFVMRVPRASALAPEHDPMAVPAGKLAGSRILVADDEPAVLELLARALGREGAQVTTVRDGQEAWERLAEADFDLVVADLRMPRLDGQELYERVAEERPDLLRRFVFASGDLARPETLAFLEGIPNRLLLKPFQPETVQHVVAHALANARARVGGRRVGV